jgi:AP-4 complex subunit epsilon-1
MLRIAADCDDKIAEEVISSVSEVRQNAGRHIQRVYRLFSRHP